MSDVQLYLLEVDKDKTEATRIASSSASRLGNKQQSLIDLITSLEPYVNNREDGGLRAKSVSYLAEVLENVSPRTLSGHERRLLCNFILGRIEGDLEGIGSSAKALSALEIRGKWDAETVQKVTKTFLDHVNPLKDVKLQTERYAIIQLFDMLLARYRTPLKQLHESDDEFMPRFVAFFDGEKDPRNLMMIFSILLVPMAEWDIRASAQDLFEAVFNYFPVTFKPPPDDPYGITAQDLKDRLRDCIAANSDFAPYAFKELLDKLDSSSMNTKRDVLQAFQACIAGYEPNTINHYSVPLWDALKFEILNVQEEDLADASLHILALIAAKFAHLEGPLNAYLRPVIKECNEHLEDAPTRQSEASGRILHAIAASSQQVAEKICRGVFPVIFNLYHSSESITKRRGLLEVFNEITKACRELAGSQKAFNVETLQTSATEALDAMLRALDRAPKAEVSFRLTALEGMALLIAVRGVMSQEQSYQVVDAITGVILHEHVQGHGDIRSEAIKRLVEVARTAPDAVRDRAIPAFLVELPDTPTDDSATVPVLEAFAQLSAEHQIFDTVVLRLKNKLNAARQQNASKSYKQALLLTMLYAFTFGSPLPDEDGIIRSSYFTQYAESLIATLRDPVDIESDSTTLETIGRICNIILRPQGVHFQSSVYQQNLHWMLPFHSGANASGNRVAILARFSLYYYAALRPEVVEADDILSLLQSQAAFALQPGTDSAAASNVLRHISLIINKFIDPKTTQSTLQSANIEVESIVTTSPSTQSTNIAFAVVKALLIQGKSAALTSKYLHLLLNILPTSDKGFARRFTTLLAPDEILTKENHCIVSGLYKQKIFSQIIPSITEAVRTADPQTKPNYLIALSGILRWLDYTLLQPSLPTLIPPLLQTLDLTDPADQDSKFPALTIFESTLMHDPTLVSEHAASLITRLLNCTAGPANAARVRAKALQCLALVPRQLKTETVVPYRRQVVKRLVPCLDDGKRDVRAEAVRCRSKWLGLDGGEERED